MRDARVADELIEVALAHGYETIVDDVSEAKERDDVDPALRGLRQERQSDSKQAVKAEFFQDTGVQHGGGGGRRAVAQRSPGVERPERNKNAKPEKQERKNEVLRAQWHGRLGELASQ